VVDEIDILDFAGMDISDDEDRKDYQPEEEVEEEEEEDDYEDDDDDDREIDDDEHIGTRNSSLAVGYLFYVIMGVCTFKMLLSLTCCSTKSNRTYVVRGSKIGVFKVTDDDQLKYANAIKKIKNSKGELFSPKKVSLC
jgi:hypothetical protein